MHKTVFLLLSTILPLCSPYVYVKSILRGISKPHRTTRLVYLIIGLLTTTSLLASGNMTALYISAASLIQSIILYGLSFRYGIGGWEMSSIVCLICALTGIAVWQITNNPLIGLYSGILADLFGSIPTIIKTINVPHSEEPKFYAFDALAGLFNILAIPSYTFQSVSYPLYLVSINMTIALLAVRKK